MSDRMYVYHEGSGTVIAMNECVLVQMDDETAAAVSDGEQTAPHGYRIDDPFKAIWFNAEALREHYAEGTLEEEVVAGLTDKDLDEAGEWAMNNSLLWDFVYGAWANGIAQVRKERAEEQNDSE